MGNKKTQPQQQQSAPEHSHFGWEEGEEEEGRRTWSWKAKGGTWGESRNNTQNNKRRSHSLTFYLSCFLFNETTKKKESGRRRNICPHLLILDTCFYEKVSKERAKRLFKKPPILHGASENLNISPPWLSNLQEAIQHIYIWRYIYIYRYMEIYIENTKKLL